jgi:sugar O-acyltransferase (sialic acid O-acetyltransferase NeuD family)
VKKKILIIGGGGHAKVVTSIVKKLEEFELIGYTDEEDRGELLGIPYLGNDNTFLSKNISDIKYSVIGIGQIKSSALRRKITQLYLGYGFTFPVIISPNAIINEDVEINEGTVIFDGVIVNSSTRIGRFAILNTHSTIEHDCRIGDFVHIAPRAVLSGGVVIGSDSLIGVGATIIQGVEIEPNVILGAGSTATKKCISGGTYFGLHARYIKNKR